MTFTSFDAVFFTVAFLVPGFIWESVLSLFLRRRDDRADRAWVRFLTLSAFNYALWSWLISSYGPGCWQNRGWLRLPGSSCCSFPLSRSEWPPGSSASGLSSVGS